jgi:hypothetical protein
LQGKVIFILMDLIILTLTQLDMKKLIPCLVLACCLLQLSCDDKDVDPDIGFIRAKINGVQTVYKVPPRETDFYNYIRPGAINIRFDKGKLGSKYWSINIIYGNTTLDVNELELPFTIQGPTNDFTGTSPDALMLIIDPDAGAYGKQIAAGSSFGHEFTLTITSLQDNVVTGTFHGVGHGHFEDGEFSAKLSSKDW